MAQSVHANSQLNSQGCCIGGRIYQACTHCGGHPRNVYNCKTCGGTGMTGYPCPVHAAYTSTGSYVSANNALSYGSNNGYGENPGSGQQGYGAASGHYVDDLGGKAV